MNINFSGLKTHLLAVLIFAVISIAYFPSMMEGKKLDQSDIQGFKGMTKEIDDFRQETGEEPLWTNSMFSGMPAYLINMHQPGNILINLHTILVNQAFRPAIHVFLYMLGFYILLLCFGMNPWLSVTGALAYGFSSYFFIILAPGHLTKAMALGYMPMIIGSVYYTFRKDKLTGGILTAIFIGLQLIANHLQITYYTMLILLIYGFFEIAEVMKSKSYKDFMYSVSILVFAVILALSVNIVGFWSVLDYSKYSMRGPTELTSDLGNQTTGLNKDYATGWSYGVGESFNLLIPNFKGGSSGVLLADRDSETFKFLSRNGGQQNAVNVINQNAYFFTQYWGTQPGTSGPVYIGAVVIFLAIFGMFYIKSSLKWWPFIVIVISLLLSWGRNFMPLTDFFLDHFPGYNKFRTVSMILIMAQFAFPFLAIMGIHELLRADIHKQKFLKSLKWSVIIVGGISLLFALFPDLSNLNSPKDEILITQGAGDLVSAIKEDRAYLLSKDAFRSLIFVLLAAGLIYFYFIKKFKNGWLYLSLSLLFLIDLWPVNKRYLNEDNFTSKRLVETPYQPYAADLEILKDPELYYRVYDITAGDPFSSARAAYFHKSIGGYHGAKMRRYQEVFTRYMSGDLHEDILDMLNTKYIIYPDQTSRQPVYSERPGNLGNAWFVDNYEIVENADEEIAKLGVFDPSQTVLIDKRYAEKVQDKNFVSDSISSIELTSYEPNHLIYEYKALTDKIAVFSDIYYDKGWNATLNGEPVDYFRANYLLRAMIVPAGEGVIEFEFKPNSYFIGNKIAYAGSALIVIFVIFGFWMKWRKK
jgi:hypothetical protein